MMECNRDEALRAKEICEKKLASQDYQGAHKFLQKALQLFPGLENTSQLSAVLDVHIAAQSKVNGIETDWYGILQVDPKADDILIKKHYKKLALLLHPDKNKYAGAESAFKLIGEALQVLSDKQQRSLHDSRRKPVISRSTSSAPRTQNRQPNMPSYASRPSTTNVLTFITMCPSCHTRYQYYRIYENQNLLCHQCHTPFLARELTMGNGAAYTAYNWQHFNHQQSRFSHASFQSFPGGAANFPGGKMPDFHTSIPPFTGASRGGNMGATNMADHLNQGMRERQSADASQGMKRKRSQDEKETEKEIRKMEKEQQRKAKADQRAQETLEKMLKKQKEQAEKASKDKKRKQKRRLSDSSEDDEDEDESDSLDDLSDEEAVNQVLNNSIDPNSAPRRSSRPRRNVTYKVDVSDDEENHTEGKKAENQNGIENESQNGDSVDLREKQKLADMFKFKIRVNLNLQKPSMSSGKPNEENVDSNDANIAEKISKQDDSRQGKSVEDKAASEKHMDHAKDTVKKEDLEHSNDSNKKEKPQQESVKKEDVDHKIDSVKKEDICQDRDPVKLNDKEQEHTMGYIKTDDDEHARCSEKKQDVLQSMDSLRRAGIEQTKGSLKRKTPEQDKESTRNSVKKKNIKQNLEPVEEKQGTEKGKNTSKKKVMDEDMEQAMDSKQKQTIENVNDTKQKQTKGSLRRKSMEQPLKHAKEEQALGRVNDSEQKQVNEHAKYSVQNQGSEHTKSSLRRKSTDKIQDSIEKQATGLVKDSKQKQNIEQSKCSTRRNAVEHDFEQTPTIEQSKVSLRRKNTEQNSEQSKGAMKRKEIEQEKDQTAKQNMKRLRHSSAKKTNAEQNFIAEGIHMEEVSEKQGKSGNFEVPDPDFYKFDKDREEKDVSPGQIWATYDETDCLPRFYCKVKHIESRRPFIAHIVWLELRKLSEHQRNLNQAGYLPACGECFRTSYSQVLSSVSNFSHTLKYEKGPKGKIKIYPRKGDVWVLYSNWKPGILPKKSGSHINWKYQIVEVLKDFSEGTCISAVILEKMKDFTSVFKRTETCLEVKEDELCKFSHQVPAYKLKGDEAPGIKGGWLELDPASVPSGLLQRCKKS